MPRLFHRVTKPVAQSTGTIEYTGRQVVENVRLRVTDYGADQLTSTEVDDVAACLSYRDRDSVTWIDVTGLHETEVIRRLGEHYGVHPLVLEDIVNTSQRPKVEDYDGHVSIVVRMLSYDREAKRARAEQLSLVLGRNYVLSFQERHGDVFDPVRERLQRPQGRLRQSGADYLAYALLDAVIDGYFVVAEAFGEVIEDLEDELVSDVATDPLADIHRLKREMVLLRRSVWPVREVMSSLVRTDSPMVDAGTVPFLRDAHDHAVQVADAVDSFRDMLGSLYDLAMAQAGNRLNDVMKVLTIFASIFVPLTFVAGVYGMNFEHMPELEWRWSYPVFWGAILALGTGMLVFFRRKKWL